MANKSAGVEAPKDVVAEKKLAGESATKSEEKTAKKTAKTTKGTAAKKPKVVKAKVPAKKSAKKVVIDEQLVESVREQVTNVAEEIKATLAESIRAEYRTLVARELQRANRRRRWNNFFHDVVIAFFAIAAIYFGYCLYDAHYFDFMKTECEKNGTCSVSEKQEEKEKQESAGPVKDATWYVANYSYLYQNLQTKLDADNVAAYYLYTDDRKVTEIKPEYLLAMAYNQVQPSLDLSAAEIRISSDVMAKAFEETFGDAVKMEKVGFKQGCLKFSFNKDEESFVATNQACDINKNREIIEKIEKIYEEGEVIYIITDAGVYDKEEQSFYRLDDLFQPAVKSVQRDDFDKHKAVLNRYQYQFKKKNDNYYFSGIVKLG